MIPGGNEKFAYVGLFDGYNGKTSSSLCREHLHDAILFEMSKLLKDMNNSDTEEALINRLYTCMIDPLNNNYDIKDIGDVYRLAYLKMDHLLSRGMHETSSIRWSGTSSFTAVIVVNDNIEELLGDLEEEDDDDDERKPPVTLGHIHVANCGMNYFYPLIENSFDCLGNVEALGIRSGEAFLMSQKHTITNKREHERVLETGRIFIR